MTEDADTSSALELAAVETTRLRSYAPMCAVDARAAHELDLGNGVLVTLTRGAASTPAWLEIIARTDQAPRERRSWWTRRRRSGSPPAAPAATRRVLELNGAARRRLTSRSEGSARLGEVTVMPPAAHATLPIGVAPAVALRPGEVRLQRLPRDPDLPERAERGVTRVIDRSGGTPMLSFRGVTMPVDLAVHTRRPNVLQVPFYIRLLLGAGVGDAATLWILEDTAARSLAADAPSRFPALARRLRDTVEVVLARALGAPAMAFRAVASPPGDEYAAICRVEESAFAALGARAGSAIRVTWATSTGRGTLHTASTSTDRSAYERAVGVVHSTAREDVPPEYTIAVPHTMLAAMGAPRNVVVLVRRDVLGVVSDNSVRLALPVAGLVVGSDLRWYWLVALVAALLVLAFLPLRVAGPRVAR